MLHAIYYIDEIVVYHDVDKDIRNIEFDIFAVGSYQTHVDFQRVMQWVRENGKEAVVMPRTEGISSTLIKIDYSA